MSDHFDQPNQPGEQAKRARITPIRNIVFGCLVVPANQVGCSNVFLAWLEQLNDATNHVELPNMPDYVVAEKHHLEAWFRNKQQSIMRLAASAGMTGLSSMLEAANWLGITECVNHLIGAGLQICKTMNNLGVCDSKMLAMYCAKRTVWYQSA